jgi:hypothetical protein
MTDANPLMSPVLVGGTGRSGSTVVGHLLDHHRDLTLTRPMEVRFITGNDGIVDALTVAMKKPGSKKAMDAAKLAADRIRFRWFERAEHVGLHTSVPFEQLEGWVEQYLADFADDPERASRTLVDQVMTDVAHSVGATRWVDTTPANARKADRVELIYPNSKVVIVTRDGRDVAASFVQQTFGPDDVFQALDQWEQRMLRAHRAELASRPGRVMSIELIDLVSRDRETSIARLCAFLDIEVDPGMVDWFNVHVTPENAHVGRWRKQFDSTTADQIDEYYERMCKRLVSEGVRIPA